MPSFLQIENISKSYGPKVLFENIGFNVNEGDKIALIAPNGTGKTSLLRILAGKDSSDSGGRIIFLKDIRIAFLEQEYTFDPDATVWQQVLSDSEEWMKDLDQDHVYEYEQRIRKFLTSFGLQDYSKKMKQLSGGEVKRVALVVTLSCEPDFYIMDEPTNHLDLDAVEYLENYLSHSRCTVLMVTHDRYFLDGVANTVMELDHGNIYVYKGNYQEYLEKRRERIDNYNAETEKVRNLLRRELEWMHASPCARTGKAKYRKNAFLDLKERAEQVYRTDALNLDDMKGASRLGTKIIDCKDVSFYYDGKCYLDSFTYNFQRYEKVGIVGRNGVGKTTFINLLMGRMDPSDPGTMTGVIERGSSLKIGYYRQEGISFDETQTVMETVPDIHLLGRFMFPHDMLNNRISTLSGGEKRRLYLLTVLQGQPNLLVMDEPTNDLDIVTLNILEEYLKEFKGTLVIVSHDRHFLDRLVDHLLILLEGGAVKDFIGNYSQYREYMKDVEAERRKAARKDVRQTKEGRQPSVQSKARRLTYNEKRELAALEEELPVLEAEKRELESALSGGLSDYEKIRKASERFTEVKRLLDEKETRWLELSMLT